MAFDAHRTLISDIIVFHATSNKNMFNTSTFMLKYSRGGSCSLIQCVVHDVIMRHGVKKSLVNLNT